jgi:hypothetical protein
MRTRFWNIFLKVTFTTLIIFFQFSNSFSQGAPPVKGNDGGVTTNGPGDPPGGSGAPLDSNAIYILLAGGLSYLLYSNRKKLLTILDRAET